MGKTDKEIMENGDVNDEILKAKAEIAEMLKEAKKEAAKIIAEAKKETETENVIKDIPHDSDGEELVTVKLHYDGERYKDDVFVAVNGERCQIKRGVPVQIKKKFARVLEQSMEQDTKTAELIRREGEKYREMTEKI